MPDTIKTIEQKRAQKAWELINDIKIHHSGIKDSYSTVIDGAGSLILSNGLMQTLAFWKSKNKEQHRKVIEHINSMIKNETNVASFDLFEKIIADATDATEYRKYTRLTLAVVIWLKRFAEENLK